MANQVKHELTEDQWDEYQRLRNFAKHSALFIIRTQKQLILMDADTLRDRDAVRAEGYNSLKSTAMQFGVW